MVCSYIFDKYRLDLKVVRPRGIILAGDARGLSSGGCYIHTLEPIAIGTPFLLRLGDGIRSCELGGKAIYMHSGNGFGIFGIGVKFESMAADERSRLDAWLGDLRTNLSRSERMFKNV